MTLRSAVLLRRQALARIKEQDAKIRDLEAKLKSAQASGAEAKTALEKALKDLAAEKASLKDLQVGAGLCRVGLEHIAVQARHRTFCRAGQAPRILLCKLGTTHFAVRARHRTFCCAGQAPHILSCGPGTAHTHADARGLPLPHQCAAWGTTHL